MTAIPDLIAGVSSGRQNLAIPIIDTEGRVLGDLQPLTSRHLADEAVLLLLTRWRNSASSMFFTQFDATRDGTLAWLRDRVLNDHARLLFLVRSGTTPVGTVGFFRLTHASAELDNLLRGERIGPATLFLHAERTLIQWLMETFGVQRIEAAVLAANFPALHLHQSLGFEIRDRAPLRRIVVDGVIILTPAARLNESGEGDVAVNLVLERKAFQSIQQEFTH